MPDAARHHIITGCRDPLDFQSAADMRINSAVALISPCRNRSFGKLNVIYDKQGSGMHEHGKDGETQPSSVWPSLVLSSEIDNDKVR